MKATELTADKAREMVKKAMENYNPAKDDNYVLIKQKIKDSIKDGFDSVFILDDEGFTGLLEQKLIDEGFSVSSANFFNQIEITWEPNSL